MVPLRVRTLLCVACLVSVPAFGQANHESDTTRFRTEVVATGLKQPTAMVFLPDGRAVLLERQSARINLIDLKSGELTILGGGPEALTGAESGVHDRNRPAALTGEDAGLHDVVLHPDYARNGWLYISYSHGPRERSTTAIDRYRLQGTRLVDQQRVFTADAWSEDRFHYGGRMVFNDGYLYVTIGDRHHQDRAQELDNHAGKILRLDADGRAPPDNPFVSNPEAEPEIWSYGHRNPQGLAVNPETGELWSGEHGPMHGDELNVIRRGGNYGWPIISYGWQYSGGPIGQGITRQDGLEQPLWVWTPAIAPSGLVLYAGAQFPTWRGSAFVGAMGQPHLNRLRVRDGRVAVEERLLNRQVGRVRLVAQDPAGFLYLGTDDGQLLRLRPAE
jgi:glucose/arabinose dehydrogenase